MEYFISATEKNGHWINVYAVGKKCGSKIRVYINKRAHPELFPNSRAAKKFIEAETKRALTREELETHLTLYRDLLAKADNADDIERYEGRVARTQSKLAALK